MNARTNDPVKDIAALPGIAFARALIEQIDDQTVAVQRELALIPAPPFGEEVRGAWVRAHFEELDLEDVRTDEVGNVIGTVRGRNATATPVMVAAHLDTVFPAATAIQLREEGGRLYVPGIADNARGLAALLAIARAIRESGLQTVCPILFVASVGEEGVGDLRGMKHLFRDGSEYRALSAFIALDGTDSRRIVTSAVGSVRYRITIRGPGGHSWADRGAPNAAHALGSAISALDRLQFPGGTPAWALNVGRIGGGTSINAIPEEAWLEIDLRSESPSVLDQLERRTLEAVTAVVRETNARRDHSSSALRVEPLPLGRRPAGTTPPESDLVIAAKAATRYIGRRPETLASSTDANVPMSLGIPSIAIGAGGESGGMHTIGEWYDNRRGPEGIVRALLTIVAAAGPRS